MFNMKEEGQAAVTITPQACLPNLLPIAFEWETKHWWQNTTPPLGFYPMEFSQQWEYHTYVYVEVSDAVLEQYRFIGDKPPTDSMPGTDKSDLILKGIVRASETGYSSYDEMMGRVYRAKRTASNGIILTEVTGEEEVPPWPEGIREPSLITEFGWYTPIPAQIARYLLPVYNNCSGNALPQGFYQVRIQWRTNAQEYLYIDIPDAELASWALLGSLEKEWRLNGCSLLEIQHIARLPLEWGEAIAHTLYREPSTGMLGFQLLNPNPDALIRGQQVEALEDIQNSYWDEDAPKECERFFAHKGDTLRIVRQAPEPDTYEVERLSDGQPFFGESLHRDKLRVITEEQHNA